MRQTYPDPARRSIARTCAKRRNSEKRSGPATCKDRNRSGMLPSELSLAISFLDDERLLPSNRSSSRSFGVSFRLCAFALLTMGWLAPATVSAAHCGRYVQSEARFEQDLARLLDAGSTAGESAPLRPPPPAPPCTGAFCSGLPAAPSVPVSAPTPLNEHRLCPIVFVSLPRPESRLFRLDAADQRPIRRASAIFHPPRRPSF